MKLLELDFTKVADWPELERAFDAAVEQVRQNPPSLASFTTGEALKLAREWLEAHPNLRLVGSVGRAVLWPTGRDRHDNLNFLAPPDAVAAFPPFCVSASYSNHFCYGFYPVLWRGRPAVVAVATWPAVPTERFARHPVVTPATEQLLWLLHHRGDYAGRYPRFLSVGFGPEELAELLNILPVLAVTDGENEPVKAVSFPLVAYYARHLGARELEAMARNVRLAGLVALGRGQREAADKAFAIARALLRR